jgi:hypothetical protein
MKHQIQSTVKNGTLTRNLNQIRECIKSFENQNVTITIDKTKKKRSNPQNAYLWGICYPIVQNCLKEAGNVFSINDVHELLKLKFLKEVVIVDENSGECLERIKSSTELSTTDFAFYTQQIQQFALDFFNTIIPPPNTELKLEV